MIEKAYEILKTYFGYSEFRYGQKELITNLINGTDCVGIMPTGQENPFVIKFRQF